MAAYGPHNTLTSSRDDPVADVFRRLRQRSELGRSGQPDLPALREEVVRVFGMLDSVVFAAAVVCAESRRLVDGEVDRSRAGCVLHESSYDRPRWVDQPRRPDLLFAGASPEPAYDQPTVVHEGESAWLERCGWPQRLVRACRSWLLLPVRGWGRTVLVFVLGSDRPAVENAGLRHELDRLHDLVAPLVAARCECEALAIELRGVKTENETLTRLNRLQRKFVTVTSHEFKTPLTSITAYVEVLQQHLTTAGQTDADEFLRVIREEAARLLRMADRFLDYSRLEFGFRLLKPRVQPLAFLVDHCAEALNPQLLAKRMELRRNLPADLPLVEVDGDLVKQVLINLVNNAVKYTPSGGRITVAAAEDAATVRVSVSDTGAGIPPEDMRRIFQQFYRVGGETSSEDGAGLGLAIVKHIVNLHGGFIQVQSPPRRGATFSFHLPKVLWHNDVPTALAVDDEKRAAWRLVAGRCLKMIAELHEARAAALVLLDPSGGSFVVDAAMGLPESYCRQARSLAADPQWLAVLCSGRPVRSQAETDPAGPRLIAPLQRDASIVGLIQVSRPHACPPGREVGFGAAELDQLGILSNSVAAALAAVTDHGTAAPDVNRIVDALEALTRTKRNNIPTATPQALRLLGATARRLGCDAIAVRQLQYVAALHDAGMVQVDEDILFKQGRLSSDEWDEVDRHPEQGAELMSPLLWTPEMARIISSHHERVDGHGFPSGIRGAEIPLGARILAVVDAFFALVQPRPYRDGIGVREAVAELRANAGTQFDAQVVETFVAVLDADEVFTGGENGGRDASSTCGTAREYR